MTIVCWWSVLVCLYASLVHGQLLTEASHDECAKGQSDSDWLGELVQRSPESCGAQLQNECKLQTQRIDQIYLFHLFII